MSRKFKKNDLMISSIFLNDYCIDNIYVSGVPGVLYIVNASIKISWKNQRDPGSLSADR
jgi:hypothetical protein